MKKLLLTIFTLLIFTSINFAQIDSLKQNIENTISGKNAKVGIAVYNFETNELISINGDEHFPMQSVYKFHIALAVLNQVDKGKFSLDQNILVKKSDLLPDTWSPLREKYPEGNVNILLNEIISYTVSLSDNNGCDILIRLLGGTENIQKFMDSIGVKDFSIKATEEEMHSAWDVQFTNWTTPNSSVKLLRKFFDQKILEEKTHDFLWNVMVKTSTGGNRIKGQLPEGTLVAHKTGTSFTNEEGIRAAVNDIGIVKLPNGNYFAVSVFVSNSKENMQVNEKIISDISKTVWDFYSHK